MDFSAADLDVSDGVRNLAAEVEHLWGREIPLERAPVGSVDYMGSGVADMRQEDGIRILAGWGFTQDVLAHELQHLRRYGMGIPLGDAARVENWSEVLLNQMEHMAIYPALKAMDLEVNPFTDKEYWRNEETNCRKAVARLQGAEANDARCILVSTVVHAILCCRVAEITRSIHALAEKADGRLCCNAKALAATLRCVDLDAAEGVREALRIMRAGMGVPKPLPLVRLVPTRPPAKCWYDVQPFGEA